MNQLFSWLKGLGYAVIVGGFAYEVHLLQANRDHWAGVDPILIIIPAGMGLLFTGVLGNFLFNRILHYSIQKNGVESIGMILYVRQTGYFVNEEPEIELTLSYYANGEQITGVIRQVISLGDIARMVEGAEIEIKYLPEEPRRVILKKGPH